MTRKIYISSCIAGFAILIGFSSCLVGPKLQDPEIQTEVNYRFDSLLVDSIGDLIWWEIFPDTQLYNLVEIALYENKFAGQTASRIEEARANLGFVKADQYPKFNAQISASRSNLAFGQPLDNAQNLFLITPSMSWEIDFWGKYRHATRAARNQLLASQYGQRAILLDLMASVINNYILLVQFDNQLEIAKRTLNSRKESTRIILARYTRGTVAEIDLNQAQIQENIAAAAIPNFERQIAFIENTMSILLGRNPQAIVRGSFIDLEIPQEIPPGLPSELLARRPDIMEGYHILAAQNELIGVAVANRLPSINLSGLIGLSATDIGLLFTAEGVAWSVGADLLQPIFQFGKNLRRVEVEEERFIQQLFTYENIVIEAFADVEDALTQIETYGRELNARMAQRNAAVNASRLSRLRYDGGQTSYLEVLDSERSMFEAELVASEIHASAVISYVNLYKSLGGGWLTLEEMESQRAAEQAAEEAARLEEQRRSNN